MTSVEAAAETARAPYRLSRPSTSVLLISTRRSDTDVLHAVLEGSDTQLTAVRCYREAVTALGRDVFAVIICDEHLSDGSWKDLLGQIAFLNEAPKLVVLASEPSPSLYAEALNLGAWELLARPIQEHEARRIVDVACQKIAGRRRPARETTAAAHVAAAG
jgi:DNA-binding NtrC family response regulator